MIATIKGCLFEKNDEKTLTLQMGSFNRLVTMFKTKRLFYRDKQQ